MLAALIQFLPWLTVGRVTFLYHYLADVPFLALLLAWWLVIGLRGNRYQPAIAAGVVIAAIALFFVTLPMLEGWKVSASYLDGMRRTFPWILP